MSANAFTPKRFVGIRPRIKQTVEKEARPTQVIILGPDSQVIASYELATEQDELEFVHGKWPIDGKFRDAKPDENFSQFLSHHVKKDSVKEAAKENRPLKPTQVPVIYGGLEVGDLVGMSLGGLGDCMAYAISKLGETKGFAVKRIPPYLLKRERASDDTEGDALLLAKLVKEKTDIFRDMAERNRALVTLRETNRLRRYLMKDRMACEARIRTSVVGTAFCSEEGGYPEGGVEKLYGFAKANDPVLQAIIEKEKKSEKALKDSCEVIPVYTDVISQIKGLKHCISAPIIGAVQDIGLFDTVGKFKKFCGLHVNGDGTFPRKRRGAQCNWSPDARQAFFLAGDMFVKFKDSYWGQRLREVKKEYELKHPNPILVYQEDGAEKQFPLVSGVFRKKGTEYHVVIDGAEKVLKGKIRYSKGHIHKMTIWRTVTEFAEWLYWKWRRMEGYTARPPNAFPPEDREKVVAEKLEWDRLHQGGAKSESAEDEGEISGLKEAA